MSSPYVRATYLLDAADALRSGHPDCAEFLASLPTHRRASETETDNERSLREWRAAVQRLNRAYRRRERERRHKGFRGAAR